MSDIVNDWAFEGSWGLTAWSLPMIKERNDIKDFGSAFFNGFKEAKGDFVETKRNHAFLNKNFLLNNDSD